MSTSASSPDAASCQITVRNRPYCMSISHNISEQDSPFTLMLQSIVDDTSSVIASPPSTHEWSASFSRDSIESMTRKAGHALRFSQMRDLLRELIQEGKMKMERYEMQRCGDEKEEEENQVDSFNVMYDILTYDDLEALKAQRTGATVVSSPQRRRVNKRYIIVTMESNTHAGMKVHYPLPLHAVEETTVVDDFASVQQKVSSSSHLVVPSVHSTTSSHHTPKFIASARINNPSPAHTLLSGDASQATFVSLSQQLLSTQQAMAREKQLSVSRISTLENDNTSLRTQLAQLQSSSSLRITSLTSENNSLRTQLAQAEESLARVTKESIRLNEKVEEYVRNASETRRRKERQVEEEEKEGISATKASTRRTRTSAAAIRSSRPTSPSIQALQEKKSQSPSRSPSLNRVRSSTPPLTTSSSRRNGVPPLHVPPSASSNLSRTTSPTLGYSASVPRMDRTDAAARSLSTSTSTMRGMSGTSSSSSLIKRFNPTEYITMRRSLISAQTNEMKKKYEMELREVMKPRISREQSNERSSRSRSRSSSPAPSTFGSYESPKAHKREIDILSLSHSRPLLHTFSRTRTPSPVIQEFFDSPSGRSSGRIPNNGDKPSMYAEREQEKAKSRRTTKFDERDERRTNEMNLKLKVKVKAKVKAKKPTVAMLEKPSRNNNNHYDLAKEEKEQYDATITTTTTTTTTTTEDDTNDFIDSSRISSMMRDDQLETAADTEAEVISSRSKYKLLLPHEENLTERLHHLQAYLAAENFDR